MSLLFHTLCVIVPGLNMVLQFFFFFKQKTAYEMRISDWSSDVCSSDLGALCPPHPPPRAAAGDRRGRAVEPRGLSYARCRRRADRLEIDRGDRKSVV